MIPLTLRRHSKKPLQPAIPKDHQTNPSRTARKAVSQPTAILQLPSQASACRAITKAICAVPVPRRLRAAFFASFFLLLKKRKSPHAVGTGVANASKATHMEAEPNALDKQRMISEERLFPIPHSSLMGGRIRTNKNQMGIIPSGRTSPLPVAGRGQGRGPLATKGTEWILTFLYFCASCGYPLVAIAFIFQATRFRTHPGHRQTPFCGPWGRSRANRRAKCQALSFPIHRKRRSNRARR